MAKRKIVWTKRANDIFQSILQFYTARNNNSKYSDKLNEEVYRTVSLLERFPFLGKKSDLELLVIKEYKIFYEVTYTEIVVHFVWDCRQNPRDLNLTE